jgi:hypothetical protein
MGFNEYIGSLLAALGPFQVFEITCGNRFDFLDNDEVPLEDSLAFITEVSDKAPQLKYFAVSYLRNYCKRVGGEWIFCDETDYMLFSLLS